jgi:hypothetical protein
MSVLGDLQQRSAGRGAHQIGDNPPDGILIQRIEDKASSVHFLQLRDRAQQQRRRLPGPVGSDPDDGNITQPRRQDPQRLHCSGVCPLQIIEADEHRVLQRGPFQLRFEFQQHPVAVLARRAQRGKIVAVQQWRVPAEACRHQRRHGNHVVIDFGPSHGRPHACAARQAHRFLQQPAFAQASPSLDEEDAAAPVAGPAERRVDHGHLRAPPPQRLRRRSRACGHA